jgi:hypothetical protein
MQIAIDRSSPKTSESATRMSGARAPLPLCVQRRTMPSTRPPAESTRAALERAFGADVFAGRGHADAAPTRAHAGEPKVDTAAGAALQRRIMRVASRPGADRDQGVPEIQAKLDVPAATSGQPLPEAVQQKMEGAFGADFSDVRIHPDSARAVALGALAYTQGSDIHVAPGRWAPATTEGQELLRHEIAHLEQQREGRVPATTQIAGVAVNDDPALEREADEIAHKAAQVGTEAAQHRTSAGEGGGNGGGAVQRMPAWVNQPDGQLDNFVNELDALANHSAVLVLRDPLLGSITYTDGYIARWKAVVASFANELTASSGNLQTALKQEPFIYAAYGYAVESLTNAQIVAGVLDSYLPRSATVSVQSTRGHTRPDVVVKDSSGGDVGWFDLTASASQTHIQGKTGSGWQTRAYVAEVTYPSLDNKDLVALVNATLTPASGGSGSAILHNLTHLVAQNAAMRQKKLSDAGDLVEEVIDLVEDIGNKTERRARFELELAKKFKVPQKLSPGVAKGLLAQVWPFISSSYAKLAAAAGYTGDHNRGPNTEGAAELIYA